MDRNPFDDKDIVPDKKSLKSLLGTSYALLDLLQSWIKDAIGSTREEWKYYGKKNGWLLKTFYNNRNLFFFQAGKDFFVVSFVFSEPAIECIKNSGISPGYIEALEQSKTYVEGSGLSVKIESKSALQDVLKLLRCKIDH